MITIKKTSSNNLFLINGQEQPTAYIATSTGIDSNIEIIHAGNNRIIQVGVKYSEYEIEGTVPSSVNEAVTLINSVVFNGGSSIQKDIVLDSVSSSEGSVFAKWTINKGFTTLKVQQSTDEGLTWVDSTTSKTIAILDDRAEITSITDDETYLIRLVYNNNTPSNTIGYSETTTPVAGEAVLSSAGWDDNANWDDNATINFN